MSIDQKAQERGFDLDRLVTAAREVLGDKLDRVILYGSLVWGKWDPVSSDIDVAILVREGADMSYETTHAISSRLDCDPLQILLRTAASFEALRAFEPCMESKALRLGIVLWAAPEPIAYLVLPEADARREVVRACLRAAKRNIQLASYFMLEDQARVRARPKEDWLRNHDNKNFGDNAHSGACWALRACCYHQSIDPSAKSIRWSVPGLLGLLNRPPECAALPDHLCQDHDNFCVGDMFDHEVRQALTAAIRTYRAARAVTGEGEKLEWRGVREMAKKIAGVINEKI